MRRPWNAFGTMTLWVAAAVAVNVGIVVIQSSRVEPHRTTRANQEMDSGASMLRDQAARMERAQAPQATYGLSTGFKQGAESGAAALRKSLQQERDRASKLEQDLGAARREDDTQIALAAKAADEASQLKKTADDVGTADSQKSLQLERDRASWLEQDLATARRDVEAQTASPQRQTRTPPGRSRPQRMVPRN
jgi:hypothetical protein